MITQIPIEKDLKESYLTYAMSVIVSRAIPDVRDGLKPVHRRILFAMHELGNYPNKPYKKSARVVGEVLGKYHPHGDAAIYDALVRMAQPFSMRYPLVDGQGNFGSIDGDPPAAMRYTEVRMSNIALELISDIDKETVDFIPNFDNTLKEPVVLPTKIPNLLINGISGIAVGMATNIPPHNLNEICDAIIATIDGKSEDEILSIVKGPDFPTGGIIVGKSGILKAYKTGRGIIHIKAKAEIKDDKILITEIPYQVSKSKIIQDIVNGVKDGRIKGIADLHDRSDKHGLLIEIKVKRDANPNIVLNQLYKHTSLYVSYGIINIALVNGQPKTLTLFDMINEFISFRKEIIRRRTEFYLKKAVERNHIIVGLIKALNNIDEVTDMLRKSNDVEEAKAALMSFLNVDETQAKAILDMKLQRLIRLEKDKLEEEHRDLVEKIRDYKDILANESRILNIIKEEIKEVKLKYGDERKTKIEDAFLAKSDEDFIQDTDVVVELTFKGFIKRIPISEFKTQRRGGKGVMALRTSDDEVKDIIHCRSKDYLLILTSKGRLHWMKAYEVPKMDRYSRGKHISSIIRLDEDESVVAILATRKFEGYLFFLTSMGIVKRTSMLYYSHPRKGGITAINLRESDRLVDAKITSGNDDILITSMGGQSIRFNENDVRPMGRTASGVIGMRLRESDRAVSLSVLNKPYILTVSERGYGKRTKKDEFRLQSRGGYGVICMNVTEKTGNVIKSMSVDESDDVIIISSKGKIIRIKAEDISLISRNTQGVKLIRLDDNEVVRDIAVVGGGNDEV